MKTKTKDEKTPKGANAPGRAERQRAGAGRWVWEWTKSIGGAVLLFIIIRTFLIQTFVITSGSMERTLLVGDFLVLNKAAYGAEIPFTNSRLPGWTTFHRRDVIVFRNHHSPNLDLVKRIVGLPGDTLAMHDGVLYLDGVPQKEPYVHHYDPSMDGFNAMMVWQKQYLAPGVDPRTYRPTLDNWGPIVVPPGHLFALGDNRDLSLDSRYWGFVNEHKVKGKVLGIYFSYNPRAPDLFPWIQDIRWKRIFTAVH